MDHHQNNTKEVIIPYRPRVWQKELHKKLKRFNVLVIHRGGGKTHFAVNETVKKMLTGPENADYVYIFPFRNQAERTVWDIVKYYTNMIPGVTYNNSTLVMRLPNGSKLTVLGADNPDSLRGLHVHGMVLDEYSEMQNDTWDVVYPMTTTHKAWVIWIGTPKGRNNFFQKYQESIDESNQENWFGIKMGYQDTNLFPPEEINLAKKTMAPHMFEQEMNCSFNSAITGSYYGKILDDLLSKHQISSKYKFDPNYAVHTAWDLGIRDKMVVWFFQLIPNFEKSRFNIMVIDYEEQSGFSFGDWARILHNRSSTLGYRYGTHWAPHDIANRELATGISRLDAAASVGINFTMVARHQQMDGIHLVRKHLHQCYFDLDRTDIGLERLRAYKAKTDRNGMGLGPLHDEASHAADAFRYLVVGLFTVHESPGYMTISGL